VQDTTPPKPSGNRYAFGSFVLDPVKRTLWRDGSVVPITAKTFEVLVVLLEQRDRTVTKDELLSRVWPSTVVHENNLARQVSSLRRVLGQRADQHDFIVTIPGEGYRFVAAVDLPDASSDVEDGRAVPSDGVPRTEAHDLGDRDPARQPAAGPLLARDAAGRDRASRVPSAALLVTVGAVLAVAGVGMLLRPEDQHTAHRRTLQRITYDEAALPRAPTWSADGLSVVYVSDRAGSGDLWKQRIRNPDPERLTTSAFDETQPAWSPDGQSIVFRSERNGGGLYVMHASGGAERIVSPFGYEPRWSPDGTRILFKRTEVLPDLPTLYVVGLDGEPPRPVRPDVLGRFTTLHAAWHPDGRRVSVWGTIGRTERRFLTVPLDGGNATVPEIAAHVHRYLADLSPGRFVWGPSRRFIYFEAGTSDAQNIWRVAVDPHTEKWSAGPEPLTTGPGEQTDIALSPDGRRLLLTTRSSRTRLWAFPFDFAAGRVTGEPYAITDGSTAEVDFDVRADGSTVAFRAVRAGRDELWERSIAEGRQRLLLSSLDGRLIKPRWSPDGAQLAFSRCAVRDDGLAVAVLNLDGTGERVVTNPADVDMQAFDWSRDARTILGACRFHASDRYATCLAPVSYPTQAPEGTVRVIASDPRRNLFNQRFSPDQRWITFLAHDLSHASTSTVYVMPSAGGHWVPMTDGTWFDDKPRWGPDGRILYFVSNRTSVPNVWGRRFDSSSGTPVGEPFQVTSFRSAQFILTPRTVQMDIAITSTHLLLPMSESRSDIWMLDEVDR
jgi:Tol biopolymer transport system component/DNA-binding winged helix-turn-helix (wHTH) protein